MVKLSSSNTENKIVAKHRFSTMRRCIVGIPTNQALLHEPDHHVICVLIRATALHSDPAPQSCRQQCHTHPGSSTFQSRSAHPKTMPARIPLNITCTMNHAWPVTPYLAGRVLFVRAQDDVGVSVVELSIVFLRPVGYL